MHVVAVVLSWNGREDTLACLESLRGVETIVVDNGSADGSADAVAERFPEVELIRTGVNLGFAAGNNVGIRATEGELLVLLNSDTIARPGALDALATRLLSDATIGAVGPRLVDADGRVELSFGPMISPCAEMRQKAVGAL